MRVGDKGRTVVPADVRARLGWREGTTLIGVDTGDEVSGGLLLLSREDALTALRGQLTGRDLVAELLEERRAAAASEDAEHT